jgi:hypothetical protein
MLLSIALTVSASAMQAAPATAAPTEPPAAAAPAPAAAEPERTPYEQMVHAAALAAARHLPDDDDRDRARRMFSSDRDDSRYFNRPGATPAVFETEWTQCRQIARRLASSRSDGTLMQAGFTQAGIVGGLLIGGLDAAFSERRARRDIRRTCLMARGWRMVEPDEAGRHRISALPRAERDAYFDRMLGGDQTEPGAHVTDWATLNAAKDGSAPARDGNDD